jgi:hypothetical protein
MLDVNMQDTEYVIYKLILLSKEKQVKLLKIDFQKWKENTFFRCSASFLLGSPPVVLRTRFYH